MKPLVWLETGIVIIYGYSLDAVSHSHYAIQVACPKSHSLCKLDGQEISQPVIINTKIEHQLQMTEGWILLIEPKSRLGEVLSAKLAGQAFLLFSPSLTVITKPPTQTEDILSFLTPLFAQLAPNNTRLFINERSVEDDRIQQLLTKLEQCLQGNCINSENWQASHVAAQLALSESRFLHLFREQLGITWRPYLLWRRMFCAIQAILNNSSATEAAHIAGFSDSAHLSRTFRNNFGMSIRQAQILLKGS